MSSRYIIWQESDRGTTRPSVRDLLTGFPEIQVLRTSDPNCAVVQMDGGTEDRIREEHPGLSIELDVQHRIAVGR